MRKGHAPGRCGFVEIDRGARRAIDPAPRMVLWIRGIQGQASGCGEGSTPQASAETGDSLPDRDLAVAEAVISGQDEEFQVEKRFASVPICKTLT